MSWSHGRQLDKFNDITYKYNADGIRTSKTISGVTTQFYLDGTKLLAQSDGNLLLFHYANEGVIGFTYQGVGTYYYIKNILGDIVGIIDNNGQIIAKYAYDAWGNHKIYIQCTEGFVAIDDKLSYTQTELNNKFIAEINPFRYRSYYYDTETGLYYLNSRYYDPETGRFINADDVSTLDVTKQAFNGLNLYAYCLNNPVNEVDESGYFILTLLLASVFVGAVIGASTSAISQGITNGWNNINWKQVGWDTLIGGISGAFSVSGFGVVGMTIISGTIGFISSVGTNLINGSNFSSWNTWLNIGISTGVGAFFGFIGGAGATNTKVLDNALTESTQFTKAALSYDKVLTKIAEGSYKNLSGAAGARALTRSTLQRTWQNIVNKTSWMEFFKGLRFNIYQSIGEIILNLVS